MTKGTFGFPFFMIHTIIENTTLQTGILRHTLIMTNGRIDKVAMTSRLLKIKEGIHNKNWYPNWDERERSAAQQALNNALDILDEYHY